MDHSLTLQQFLGRDRRYYGNPLVTHPLRRQYPQLYGSDAAPPLVVA